MKKNNLLYLLVCYTVRIPHPMGAYTFSFGSDGYDWPPTTITSVRLVKPFVLSQNKFIIIYYYLYYLCILKEKML